MSMEYELGTIYVKYAGGQIRQVASDQTLERLGFTPIFERAVDYTDCPALHAEANALMRGDRVAREGGTIYVTSHVCMGCAKLIANSGLRDVVVAAQHDGAHREPEKVYRFLDQCGISVMIA